MNREIKFRAWDEDRKQMIFRFKNNRSQTPSILQNDNKDEFNLFCGSYKKNGDWQEPVLMQYTGLKDNKGVEIYEGDIMEWADGDIGVVTYETNSCQFRIQPTREFSSSAHIGLNIVPPKGTAIVVGNIYENPELLK